MFKTIWNLFLRLTLCTLTFHAQGNKIQSHKAFDVYSCPRCGNMFSVKKLKYQNKESK